MPGDPGNDLFDRLPTEIVEMILAHLLIARVPVRPYFRPGRRRRVCAGVYEKSLSSRLTPNVLLTCKRLNCIGIPLLYSRNALDFASIHASSFDAQLFASTVGLRKACLVRTIYVGNLCIEASCGLDTRFVGMPGPRKRRLYLQAADDLFLKEMDSTHLIPRLMHVFTGVERIVLHTNLQLYRPKLSQMLWITEAAKLWRLKSLMCVARELCIEPGEATPDAATLAKLEIEKCSISYDFGRQKRCEKQ